MTYIYNVCLKHFKVNAVSDKKTNLVVKTNQLNMALQALSKVEVRMIQLAIVDARETNTGLDTNTPLRLDAMRYAEMFGGTRQNAYDAMKRAEDTLFNRRFTYVDDNGKAIKSRWLQQVQYFDGEGAIELVFTVAVVNGISRINGLENFFTSYLLEQTVNLNSIYSVRLYELLVQWKTAKKTPLFELETFRGQMGVGVNEYKGMSDFKRRVLDAAIKEINKETDLTVSYEQVKRGKRISGFKFTIKEKDKPKIASVKNSERDQNTADMFTIDGLNDKQLGRITRNPSFVADYNHLVSSTSPAGQDTKAWEFEMINRLKKDASQFKKRPIKDYLEY